MAKKMSGLSREFIIHPGETLKEILDDRDMTQRELALRTNVREPHISGIVNCQKPISASFAKKLEYALEVDASFWINLQANYDKEVADFEELNQISDEELGILQKIKGLSNYAKEIGLISPDATGPMLIIEWRKRLNLSSLMSIPQMAQAGAYRLASSDKTDPFILFTWLRITDLITKNQEVSEELDIDKLKSRLGIIRRLVFEDFDTLHSKLKMYLAECGIKFAIVRHFTGAPVQGVIKRNHDNTLCLIMTVRHKFADVFWFTLFHEIGHIINGDIDGLLVDYESSDSELEDRADEFAASTLMDSVQYRIFTQAGDFTLQSIHRFCLEQEIPVYLLIGRLQRDRHIEYRQYNQEKVRYTLDEAEMAVS